MEKTLDTFKSQQTKTLEILNNLTEFLQQGKALGVPLDNQLLDKLQTAKETASSSKLHIALIGGFSEGKTSIAAAWMEKLDKASMKISQQESSNEVKVYDVGPDCVLIDTPGLFGFKEQHNADTNSIEKYKDITKKYVSEAHLVLYVMNSTNPIKESHKDDLQWLFRTLKLLDRTVFVLSRFDEVADVENEIEYKSNAKIKCENVASRLEDLIGLTTQERQSLSIVAVAANPFDMGTEYWLANPEKFRSLSHIKTLQDATNEKIQHSGGILALGQETKKSVIIDVLTRKLPQAITEHESIQQQVNNLAVAHERLHKELAATQAKMTDVKIRLRTFVTDYFSDLILQVSGSSLETFMTFFEREVGDDGIIINARLQNEYERQLQSVCKDIEKTQSSYNAQVSHYNNTLATIGKQGLNYAIQNSNLINNTAIFTARDGIASAAKMVGMDLGNILKFKPWGAIKFAKGLSGILAVAGLAMEAWDSYQKAELEEEFTKMTEKMKKDFAEKRKHLLESLDSQDFETKYFTGYTQLHEQISELELNLRNSKERQSQFAAWRKQAEVIDVEFKVINT